ncbi:MAG: hypothetical protein JWN67_3733 [Actinomycetia bacterium]|nr:hypothetical protein [Actinomycetes bacterium]
MVSLRKLRSTAATPGAHPLPTPALPDITREIQP